MLQLDNATLIGTGLHRECYLHPRDESLCVKIVVAGNSDENRREARYYSQLAARGICWDMLTRFHGLVPTSKGEGAVFDLVRDWDGVVSRTLAEYLARADWSTEFGAILQTALPGLRDYLLRNRVVTMTLKSKNILVQRESPLAGRLVVIDNVGNSDFIPLSHQIALLGRRKIRRKWRRFEAELIAQHPENEVLRQILATPP